jgi:hypothetical protein
VCRWWGTMGQMTDRSAVRRWLAGYEAAWHAPGTEGLAGLFASDATYLQSRHRAGTSSIVAFRPVTPPGHVKLGVSR